MVRRGGGSADEDEIAEAVAWIGAISIVPSLHAMLLSVDHGACGTGENCAIAMEVREVVGRTR